MAHAPSTAHAPAHGAAPAAPPVTEGEFLRTRERGWEGFLTFTKWMIGLNAALLILMALFLT